MGADTSRKHNLSLKWLLGRVLQLTGFFAWVDGVVHYAYYEWSQGALVALIGVLLGAIGVVLEWIALQ